MRIVKRYKLFISFILLHSVTLCYKLLHKRLFKCIVFFMERRIIITSTNETEQEMTAYFVANGRKFEYYISVGITCRKDIIDFAKYMGWKHWEFHCISLGIFEKG